MTELSVYIDYDDPVISELIQASVSRYIQNIIKAPASKASLQWSSYESISFETIISNPKSLCNSYIFRKALIRKHFLATTVQTWLSKNPTSLLSQTVPKTYLLECDYSDYLDEALNESFELREALQLNEDIDEDERKYFILKPSMTDRGQGIRLFSTRDDLEAIFDDFDDDFDDEDELGSTTGVIASQLRHFVVQEYMSQPLLLETILPGRKFHIRTYVVAFGALKVWVWSEMLALFASEKYESPTIAQNEMDRHLTNTGLQDGSDKDDNVMRFWSLPLSDNILNGIFKRVCEITGEVFLAAAAGQQMHFQVRRHLTGLMLDSSKCV
jgi:tubulin---tyrosine ligase